MDEAAKFKQAKSLRRMDEITEFEIIVALLMGYRIEDVVKKFDICATTVSNIRQRKTKHYYTKYLNFPHTKQRLGADERLKLVIDDYNNKILSDTEVLTVMQLIDIEEFYHKHYVIDFKNDWTGEG